MSLFFCPSCRETCETRVTNSRPGTTNALRRRECANCGVRFTTQEIARPRQIRVFHAGTGDACKFAAERIASDVENASTGLDLRVSIVTACNDEILRRLDAMPSSDLLTEDIRRVVEEELRRLHPVAWYRYAIGARHLSGAAECLKLLTEELVSREDSPHGADA